MENAIRPGVSEFRNANNRMLPINEKKIANNSQLTFSRNITPGRKFQMKAIKAINMAGFVIYFRNFHFAAVATQLAAANTMAI